MKKSLFLCLSVLLLVVTGCKKEVESVTVMPESITITVNGVSFKMIKVDGGTFTMGATPEQGDDAFDSEMPAHSVTLSDYCIGQTEVTQELWQAVMGSNPSYFKGSKLPVEEVCWNDCQQIHCEAEPADGKNVPPADGGGVGVRGPRRKQEQRIQVQREQQHR